MPIAEWVDNLKLIVEAKAPSLPPFHPAISIPGRSGLRVVTKGFPAR
jgi:tetrahydromethanopterin S-methyltransferase subunit B